MAKKPLSLDSFLASANEVKNQPDDLRTGHRVSSAKGKRREPIQESALSEKANQPVHSDKFKQKRIGQTVYLPPLVHRQLRALAFEEERRMHDYLMEGLDLVFRKRGLKSVKELTEQEK